MRLSDGTMSPCEDGPFNVSLHLSASGPLHRVEMTLEPAEFAWPGGDTPGTLQFSSDVFPECVHHLAEGVRKLDPSLRGTEIRAYALTPTHGSVVGRYRLVAGKQSFFARITSRIGDPRLEAEVTGFLAQRHPGTRHLLFFDLFEWRGKRYRLDIHPFFQGRHFNGSTQDLFRISESLGRLHRCLEGLDGRARVRSAAEKRYRRLAEVVEVMADAVRRRSFAIFQNAEDWMKEHRDWIVNMSESFDPFLHLLPDAQCLHGEVHPGNVLLSDREGQAVWVDFEESVHTYTSPSWDLAFLIQRFCLADNPSTDVVHERLETIRTGYKGEMRNVVMMMKQAAWFSMAVLVDQTINNHIVSPLSEYDKFERLERQADLYKDVLREYETDSFFRP